MADETNDTIIGLGTADHSAVEDQQPPEKPVTITDSDPVPYETEAQRRERVAAQERKRHALVTMDALYNRYGRGE